MYKKLSQFALPVLMFAFVGTAQAEVITFTDKGSPFFDTTNVVFIDTDRPELASTGFGTMTGWAASIEWEGGWWLPNYEPPKFASSSTELFNIDSMWLVSEQTPMALTIKGYANGVEIATTTFTITTQATEYSSVFADFKEIDSFTIDFSPAGPFVGYRWGMGSVAVTVVPEPEAYAMLLAGLGLVGVMARRRQRS